MMPEHTSLPELDIAQILDSIQDRIQDIQERRNRGALLVEIIIPLDSEEIPNRGDMIEVIPPDGRLKHAEVIDTKRITACHPEYDSAPCVKILVEVLDPDRMTRDDFESLYGDADTQEEIEDLGPICECGADRSGCQQNQELFGLHVNASYEDE